MNVVLYFKQIYDIIDIVEIDQQAIGKDDFMNAFKFKELKTWSVIFSRDMVNDYKQNHKTGITAYIT